MKKLILIATLLLGTYAHAQPEGTLDCNSADSKFSASFLISNYGDQTIYSVQSLTIGGKSVDLTSVKIYRQWVDQSVANVNLTLPSTSSDQALTLALVTKAAPDYSYAGSATVRQQKTGDYANPVTTVSQAAVTCVVNP